MLKTLPRYWRVCSMHTVIKDYQVHWKHLECTAQIKIINTQMNISSSGLLPEYRMLEALGKLIYRSRI